MGIEANIVYLDEELKSNQERLELMEKHLKENPAISIYKRKINNQEYYYKKYWKDGKSISEFLCKDEADYQKHLEEIKVLNEKRNIIKVQFKKLKQITTAQERQLKIARKTYENV